MTKLGGGSRQDRTLALLGILLKVPFTPGLRLPETMVKSFMAIVRHVAEDRETVLVDYLQSLPSERDGQVGFTAFARIDCDVTPDIVASMFAARLAITAKQNEPGVDLYIPALECGEEIHLMLV